MTRTLFTLGELTLGDPDYTGPHFDIDKIAKDVNDKASFVWIHCDNLYKKILGNWGNFGLTSETSSFKVSYGTITRPNRSDPNFSSCVFSPKHRNFQENPQYSKFSKYPKLSKYLNAQLGSHGTFGHTNRPDRYSKAGTRQLKIFTNQRKSAWVTDIYKIRTNKNSSTSFLFRWTF